MGKHYRTTKSHWGKWLAGLLILLAIAAVAVFAGAVLFSGEEEYGGTVLPGECILPEGHRLIPQKNGGFLLLSSDEAENQTKGLYLTQDCNVADSDYNYIELLGVPSRIFVSENAAHLILDEFCVDEAGSLMELITIESLPLDGSFFGARPEPISFNNMEAAINLETLSADENGRYYGLSADGKTIVSFTDNDQQTWSSTQPFPDIILSGMTIHGATAYFNGMDEEGGLHVWQSAITEDGFSPLSEIQVDGDIFFPLTVLSDNLVVDQYGMAFLFDQQSGMGLSLKELYGDGIGAGIMDTGEIAALTAANEIGRFTLPNLATAQYTYQYPGTICAMAVSDNVAALLYDGQTYRGILLSDKNFGIGVEPPPEESEPESSENTSAEAPSSSGESTPESSSLPESSDSSSDIELPLESGLDSSETSSALESDVSSDTSSDTSSEEKEMLSWIVSSQFTIDRGSNVVVLPQNITVAQFRKTVPLEGATLTAENSSGGIVTSGKLGTGMRLKLYNDWELMDEITVVVRGDLNGNGVINTADERLLFQHLTEEQMLTEYFYTAADLNEDGRVETIDLLLLKQHQY